ncbi:MAG: S41 family peptidase [Bacteroidales bacterium]|jgi:carboxyl-terminal processing protease|nr:S41 family peptidase [Bacteroidales bacterium]
MKKNICISLVLTILMSCTIVAQNASYSVNNTKMNQVLRSINDLYVDTVDFTKLVETGIVEILKELDPHSVFIPAKEVATANEPLQGAFDGIGITFQIIKDTVNVMEVLVGGPSEKVGLMAGDKIVKVDTFDATGKKISNKWVADHVRGTKGTKVHLFVKRGKRPELIEFTITRDKIPMNSINVSFMVDKNTGYIRLERFAQTSTAEFEDALKTLKTKGLKNLIFDLRGNGGGYLDVAFKISNQFIKENNLIVYTDNVHHYREEMRAQKEGLFKNGKLILLVDENSASASEIVSGAVQDWDRGLILGRRTFGKGLVQRPLNLQDHSQIRLTTSHYYTPTGRCIQKPYNDGLEQYFSELNNRYKRGEYITADSVSFPDSLKYYTPRGRVVYGGGGIMPDIFIPYDTSKYSTLYNEMYRKGLFSAFTLDYMESNKENLAAKYPTIDIFKKDFNISDDLYQEFMAYAKKEGIKDTVPLLFSARMTSFINDKKGSLDSLYTKIEDINQLDQLEVMMQDFIKESYNMSVRLRNEEKAGEFIKEYLKFEFARNLFTFGEAYQIFLLSDDTFQHAVTLMKEDKTFQNFKINY